MDTSSLTTEPGTEPLPVPADRLFRFPVEVYQGMVDHGLIVPEEVALEDGLLVEAGTNGPGAADLLYRMTLNVYDEAVKSGLLGPNDRTELLDGLLVKKMTKRDPHIFSANAARDALAALAARNWYVFKEDPVVLGIGASGYASEPEPDLQVARGTLQNYRGRKPRPEDVTLVVEVADSSLNDDRKKLARYAWADIPVAWIVNLVDRTIEVYANPTGPVAPAEYQEMTAYRDGDEVPVVLDGREVGRVAVADLLP